MRKTKTNYLIYESNHDFNTTDFNNFCILFFFELFIQKFDLLPFLGGASCALFISRYCIHNRFTTSKTVEGFFLHFFFRSVN